MSEWRKSLYLLIIFFVLLSSWFIIYHYIYDEKMIAFDENIVKEQQFIDLKIEQINKVVEEDADKANYYLYIPKESGKANILDFFTKTAFKNGVNIDNINIDGQANSSNEEEKITGLPTLVITATVSGDYTKVRSFIKDIDAGNRLLKLSTWQWDIDDQSTININLSYLAYYYPNNYDQFLDLPPIPAYKPADRVDPIN